MHEKKELRKEMLVHRDAMSLIEKLIFDTHICNALWDIIIDRKFKVVHCYIPMGSEIDIKPVIEKMLAAGIMVVAPKALKQRQLQNLVLQSLTELESGIYGTQHPAGGIEYTGEIDMFIIPGLAFDKDNYRLGYGSGYYDSFLNMQPDAYKLGICYPFQFIAKVPTEAHDVQLSKVIW